MLIILTLYTVCLLYLHFITYAYYTYTFYLQVQHPPLTHCVRHKASVLKATYFTPRLFSVPTNRNCNPLSYTQLWRHCTILRWPKLCWQIQNCTWLHSAICWCAIRMTWPHKHVYHVSHKRVANTLHNAACRAMTRPHTAAFSSPPYSLPASYYPHSSISGYLCFWKVVPTPGMINSFKFSLIVQNIWIQPRTVIYEPPESESNLDFSSEILLQATTQIQSGKQPHKYKVVKNNTNTKWQATTQIGNTFCPCLCLAVFHLTAMYICLTRALGHTWYLCVMCVWCRKCIHKCTIYAVLL